MDALTPGKVVPFAVDGCARRSDRCGGLLVWVGRILKFGSMQGVAGRAGRHQHILMSRHERERPMAQSRATLVRGSNQPTSLAPMSRILMASAGTSTEDPGRER